MLDNGNRKIFMKKFVLQETDACFFAKRFKNMHAQHNYRDAHEILKSNCYYDFRQEIGYLQKLDRDHYGGSYEVIDHSSKFFSSIHKCYIMTAQPYEFHDNYDLIKNTLDYYHLSFTIIKDLTWHTTVGDCTLYCIGDYDNLVNVFGRVDSIANIPF